MCSQNDATDQHDKIRRLVVDDIRIFNFEADYCRNTDEFRALYPDKWTTGPYYDECWLDNDMGYNSPGGDVIKLVKEIEAMAHYGDRLPIGVFVIHTSNPVAAHEIATALNNAHYKVRRVDANDYLYFAP